MEPNAESLMFENISKNLSDADEYPAMMVCCVIILSLSPCVLTLVRSKCTPAA